MKFLKRFLLTVAILLLVFVAYVFYVNRNSKNMTFRQKVLKTVYPALMWWTKMSGKNTLRLSNQDKQPPVSFYSLHATLNNGSVFDFSSLQGKKVLLVNTASNCGYTEQYDALQKLYEENKDKLVVLGFPANDFKQQEKGSDEEIASFCRLNFGVTFPLMKKSGVIKNGQQNEVYQWLTDPARNGWNSKQPSWNFSKYLVSENGVLVNYFDPSVSPLSDAVIQAIKE